LVIKDRDGNYPTQEGQRVWVDSQDQDDAGHAGERVHRPTTAPTSVLSFPLDVGEAGDPVTAGSTTVLTETPIKKLPPLHATGGTFERTFARQ